MTQAPANQTEHTYTENITTTPSKRSPLKWRLGTAALVMAGGVGGASYVAYDKGMANAYLPEMLQKSTTFHTQSATPAQDATMTNNGNASNAVPVAVTPTDGASTATIAATTAAGVATVAAAVGSTDATANAAVANNNPVDANAAAVAATPPNALSPNSSNTPSPATDTSVATNTAASPAATSPAAATTNSATAQAGGTTAAASNLPAQPAAAPSVNMAPALLSAMDAQMQWQSLQYQFQQNWDTSAALSQVAQLKQQLTATGSSAFLPTLSALGQVEGQLQAWHAINPQLQLASLNQSMGQLEQVSMRTVETPPETAADGSLWGKFLRTFKQIFEVKRVHSEQDKAVSAANAAVIKQSIAANLMSAQWSARSGQWGTAQEHTRQAKALVTQYAQNANMEGLNGMLNQNTWPQAPDFATVGQALSQARQSLSGAVQVTGKTTAAAATAANKP